MSPAEILIVTALVLVVIFVLAKFTNIFKVAPGQEINWGRFVKDSFQYLLAFLITAGFFGVTWLLLTKAIPPDNKTELDIVLGALVSTFTGGVVGYFFGSSKGSQAKDDTIIDAATK